jgi:biotin-(acetyl-CoA carboxylase) ligase
MALELDRQFDHSLDRQPNSPLDCREVLERFYVRLTERLNVLRAGGRESLLADYHSKIYRLDTPARYALPDGTEFTGTIRGVQPSGELLIDDGTTLRSFLFREVSFII